MSLSIGMACFASTMNHILSLLRALDLVSLCGTRMYRRSSRCLVSILWTIPNIVVTSTTTIVEVGLLSTLSSVRLLAILAKWYLHRVSRAIY
ncbi:hypothetical protein V6N12_033007 [Hibiscus sabdariffa]|uniref:Uncharacterized protein n=1 Tax=Hibiscus sabdariffa TaxID=183260 RepID=A0ABR2CES8_9ROSI